MLMSMYFSAFNISAFFWLFFWLLIWLNDRNYFNRTEQFSFVGRLLLYCGYKPNLNIEKRDLSSCSQWFLFEPIELLMSNLHLQKRRFNLSEWQEIDR